MGLLDKLKDMFFEEEVEEELDDTKTLARKVEIPKKVEEEPKKEEESMIIPEKVIIKPKEEEKIELKREEKKEEIKKEVNNANNKFSMFEEEDFVFNSEPEERREEKRPLYPEHKEESYAESMRRENNNYGYTKTYYESRETKTFTPTPIISPVYGILDKNYKKEEVVTKREIRITSNYGKADLDSVRNKAFGAKEEKKVIEKIPPRKSREAENKIYDVNNNKPTVKGVTLEDADEYYNDLGLAYNVDYKDRGRDDEKEETKEKVITNLARKKEKNTDDNLFDLIESMYDKEE